MIFWTVKDGELIKLERSGKCNQCGKCCRNYRIQFRMEVGGLVHEHGEGEDKQEEDWATREGWSMFVAQGTWWYFGEFLIAPEVFEGYHCPALKNDDVCSEWQKEGFRPICRYWPFHPDNLELFPNCGFSFERIPE